MRKYTIVATGVRELIDGSYLASKCAIKPSADILISFAPVPTTTQTVSLKAGRVLAFDNLQITPFYIKWTINETIDIFHNTDNVTWDISVTLNGSDIEIWAVEWKDWTTDTRWTIWTKGSTTALNTAIVDASWNQITSFWGVALPPVTHRLLATYLSATQITLATDIPFTFIDNWQLVYIRVVPTSWATKLYQAGVNCTLRVDPATNIVTISDHTGTAFATGDVYEVGCNDWVPAYDQLSDSQKVTDLVPKHFTTDSVSFLASAQTLTGSWADLVTGYEIPTDWKKSIWLLIKSTVQLSTWIQVRALAKTSSWATLEATLPIKTVSSTIVNVAPETVWFPDWVNFIYFLTRDLNYAVPLVQFQVMATVVGWTPWTIDNAEYTLWY